MHRSEYIKMRREQVQSAITEAREMVDTETLPAWVYTKLYEESARRKRWPGMTGASRRYLNSKDKQHQWYMKCYLHVLLNEAEHAAMQTQDIDSVRLRLRDLDMIYDFLIREFIQY